MFLAWGSQKLFQQEESHRAGSPTESEIYAYLHILCTYILGNNANTESLWIHELRTAFPLTVLFPNYLPSFTLLVLFILRYAPNKTYIKIPIKG